MKQLRIRTVTENEEELSEESDLDDFGCGDIRDPFLQNEEDEDEDNEDEPPHLVEAHDNRLDEDDSSDEESEVSQGARAEPTALVFYSTRNNPSSHMGPPSDIQNCLRFSLELVPSISYLMQSYPNFVSIKSIPKTESQDTNSVLGMVVALWSCGILICEKSNKRQQKLSSKQERKRRRLK